MSAAPLDAALAQQLLRLERATMRVLQGMSAVGFALGVGVGVTLSSALGYACAAIGLFLFGWYTAFARFVARDSVPDWMRVVGTVFDALVPWVLFAVIALRQGAIYALGSWVPPMLFCGMIMAHAVRLRPRECMGVGVIGSAIYFTVYFFVAYPNVPAHLGSDLLFAKLSMQVTRAISLTLAAAIAAVLASGLKVAIGRAGSEVRSQDLFGKYRLVRRIASGGMGMVFEALYCPEGGFERRVAVKRIHPHLAAEKKFVDAFRDEAELSARLAHPAIVQVFDFGRVADSFFLAMEFVDGMTLSALVHRAKQRGVRLSPALVAFVMRGILRALAYAHEGALGPDGRPLRVVHRDLCPANVLVSRNGEVKVTDFGIARSLSDVSSSMTQSVSGHAGYMAPEQARAETFDVRVDLFPAGCIAWELFALRPLYRRESHAASIAALLQDTPLPIDVERPDLDRRWVAWISRAIARDPAERFGSATEMLTALEEIADARASGLAEALGKLVVDLGERDVSLETRDGREDAATAVDLRAPPDA